MHAVVLCNFLEVLSAVELMYNPDLVCAQELVDGNLAHWRLIYRSICLHLRRNEDMLCESARE